MIDIKIANSIHVATDTTRNVVSVDVHSRKKKISYDFNNKVAYSPLINAHDHLASNWSPRTGTRNTYINIHIWIEETKHSESYLERSKIWTNNGDFDLTTGNAKLLALLGMYKNIFSGVHIISDHTKPQKPEYYDWFDIYVVPDFAHCKSISFLDLYNSISPEEDMIKTKGIIPFIIHLAEGVDNISIQEFDILLEKGLLQRNTLIVHGIALKKENFFRIAQEKASICWCPGSNMSLYRKTLDVPTALESGVNITIGTDSTISGGGTMFDEIRHAKRTYPEIPTKFIYDMVTKNAETALLLFDNDLLDNRKNLLILDKKHDDIYENLLYQDVENIDLLIHQSKPIYGNINYFEDFELSLDNYEIIKIGNKEKFIIGKPTSILEKINEILGYKKNFPYLPF